MRNGSTCVDRTPWCTRCFLLRPPEGAHECSYNQSTVCLTCYTVWIGGVVVSIAWGGCASAIAFQVLWCRSYLQDRQYDGVSSEDERFSGDVFDCELGKMHACSFVNTRRYFLREERVTFFITSKVLFSLGFLYTYSRQIRVFEATSINWCVNIPTRSTKFRLIERTPCSDPALPIVQPGFWQNHAEISFQDICYRHLRQVIYIATKKKSLIQESIRKS